MSSTSTEQINPLQQLDTSRGSSDSLLSNRSASSTISQNEPQLSFFVIVAFTANYVMGTGFLTLPWAFYKCGTLLGIFVLFFMIGPSIMSVSFILETLARANIFYENNENRNVTTTIELSSIHQEQDTTASIIDTTEVIDFSKSNILNPISSVHISDINEENSIFPPYESKLSFPIVGNKKFETTELCEIFLGKFGKQLYALSISIFLYGTLWAYGTVFASAMITHINFGPYSYHLFLFIFSLIVVPLSCMELSEQLYLQIILSFCRIIMVLLMISTVLYATITKDDLFALGDNQPSSPYNSHDWKLLHWTGLHYMLPISVYSNMFHHSIPALSEPAKDKRKLGYMFATALLCCCFSYTLIGSIVSLYFKDTILSSSNLNWENFGKIHDNTTLGMLERCIASYVIIFPALDVSSAFPLNAITLGNNLYTTFHSNNSSTKSISIQSNHSTHENPSMRLTTEEDDDHEDGDDQINLTTRTSSSSSSSSSFSSLSQEHENNKSRNLIIFYRLLASIPPLIFAAFISDLGTITDYTGITGMIVVFVFPSLLSLQSEKLLSSHELPTQTYYSSIFTRRKSAIFLLIFGILMILYTLVSLALVQ